MSIQLTSHLRTIWSDFTWDKRFIPLTACGALGFSKINFRSKLFSMLHYVNVTWARRKALIAIGCWHSGIDSGWNSLSCFVWVGVWPPKSSHVDRAGLSALSSCQGKYVLYKWVLIWLRDRGWNSSNTSHRLLGYWELQPLVRIVLTLTRTWFKLLSQNVYL